MLKEVIGQCPICAGELHVTKLSCHQCSTEISGQFRLSKFNQISKENLYFIELFMKNKGNIKQLEKELNVSYPTVKKMLDEVIVQLGYTPEEEDKPDRETVLKQLADGEISKEEALKRLKG